MRRKTPSPPRPGLGTAARGLIVALVAGPVAGGCGPDSTSEAPPGAPEATSGLRGGPVFPAQNRPDVRGTHGAVTADHPLAAAVGLDVLRRGGNATDAVVAMAAVLAVVRPHMNGVGGDAFALFYDGATGEVSALNGSGRAGALATPEFFAEAGRQRIPSDGPLSVSVPGAVAAWVDALERHGSMTLSALLEPAVGYARDGFPVTPRLARDFASQGGSLEGAAADLYLPGGEPPRAGPCCGIRRSQRRWSGSATRVPTDSTGDPSPGRCPTSSKPGVGTCALPTSRSIRRPGWNP